MRQFKFRLEKILSYRHSLTEAEKVRFAAKIAALNRAREKAINLRRIRNQLLISRLRAFQSGLTAREAANLHEHIVRISDAISAADREVEIAEAEVNKARDRLVEKRREERAIELLRKRRYQSWIRDFNRDETKTLDDVATIRHVQPAE